MVGKTVRVTKPSRSSPRNVSVSMRCEMPATMRLSSLKRLGPSNSIMMTKTLHLSPTRARTEATPRQSACASGDSGRGGRAGTLVFSGFTDVPSFQRSALGSKKCVLVGLADSHSYSVSYKPIPRCTPMKKLLHIDSSVLGPHSVSRQLSAAIVDRLRQAAPGIEVTYRDLSATPLTHLSGAHLAAAQGAANPDAALAQDLAAGQAVMNEFLAADTVVLGAPMYNFTIPSQLKAWIDRIIVVGKTFKYDAQGPQGLAGDKRVIVAISRGGFYGPGV